MTTEYSPSKPCRRRNAISAEIVRFFVYVVGGTWLFWSVPIRTQMPVWDGANAVWIYLGGSAPFITGLVFIWRDGQQQAMIELGARLIDPRRIPWRWWLITLSVLPMLLIGVGMAMETLAPDQVQWFALMNRESSASSLASYLLFILVLGPLPEEVGWRGYGLDTLLRVHGPFTASLLLATAWSIWHLPLGFMQGYYTPFGGPPQPWVFFPELLATTIVMTWIYVHTNRSVLAMVLYHYLVNLSGDFVELTDSARLVFTVCYGLLALAIAISLRQRSRPESGDLPR